MSTPFLGQIILVGFNFAPRGWATCSGQLLPISQNTALFSLLGTQYGGDGQTTFALPDLRSRVPVGTGQGAGLSPYVQGEVGGAETETLNVTQMPIHTHVATLAGAAATVHVKNAAGNQQTPVGNVPAIEAAGVTATYSNAAPDAVMAPGTISLSGNPTVATAGGSQPFGIIQPFLGLLYIIALQGIFPSRN
jgi:microcystin-dependent protein